MKKLIYVIIALALCLALTACGGDAPEETDAPETDAPETDAPETDAPETDAPESDAPEEDKYEELSSNLIIANMTHNVIFGKDYSTLTPSDVFYFLYYFHNDYSSNSDPFDPYATSVTVFEGTDYEREMQVSHVPVSVLNGLAEDLFGYSYDFTEMPVYDPTDAWSLGYNASEDTIVIPEIGGFGGFDACYEYLGEYEENGDEVILTWVYCVHDFETGETTQENTATVTMRLLENGNWRIISAVENK